MPTQKPKRKKKTKPKKSMVYVCVVCVMWPFVLLFAHRCSTLSLSSASAVPDGTNLLLPKAKQLESGASWKKGKRGHLIEKNRGDIL
jgi:hypothetical protein